METYQGICIYCGTVQPVMAKSQSDADSIITRKCSCGGYEHETRISQLDAALLNTVGEECSIYNMEPLDIEVVNFLREAGVRVADNLIQRISVNVNGSTVKISVNSKGVVKVDRVESCKISAEC